MKTLAEHNKQRMEQHDALRKMQEPHANGVACPECGAELWDSNPMVTLTSNPPQKNVHCPKCDYRGYIQAGISSNVALTGKPAMACRCGERERLKTK